MWACYSVYVTSFEEKYTCDENNALIISSDKQEQICVMETHFHAGYLWPLINLMSKWVTASGADQI